MHTRRNVKDLRKDFSVLVEKKLAYLDNAATSLMPWVVMDAMVEYYLNYKGNVYRGVHDLSERATLAYEESRKKIARFIHANPKEIIFTRGTTDSLNLVARGLDLKKGDEILVSAMEHHSNLLPWQALSEEKGVIIKYIPVVNGKLDMTKTKALINNHTKVVAVTHVSNVLGTINPIKEISNLAHQYNALVVVDGAQSVAHFPINVKQLDCDFFAFSGHKMMGPTGIGVLYGKRSALERLDPVVKGGGMVSEASFEHAIWNDIPMRFEAGTPPIGEAIGLGRAITYLEDIGMDRIHTYEKDLVEYALLRLKELEGVEVYGPTSNRSSVISFRVKGIHGHDVATILNSKGVAIRAGHLCAMPLVREVLNVNDVCRASLSFYNNYDDIDRLIKGIKEAQKIFR